MAVDFQIPKGALLPLLTATLTHEDGPVDLTGATVRFQMRAPGSAELKVDAPATVASPETAGEVTYSWVEEDTDTEGLYLAWFHATFTGKPMHAPEPPFVVEITRGAG
jgi:hypothetical protein